jgi:hypothetical protein
MKLFIIDADNNITAVTEKEAAAAANGAEAFGSEKDLQRIAAQWPADRLVEVWNSIAGVKAVTRFTSRAAGVARVWKAIQGLATAASETEPAAEAAPARARRKKTSKASGSTKPGSPAKSSKAAKPAAAREGSKKADVVEMMQRKGGCTLAEIMKATGWQAHTVRGFVSGTLGKKMGLTVTSTKNDQGERTYSLPR